MSEVIAETICSEFALDMITGTASAGSVRASALEHKTADHSVEGQSVIIALLNQTDTRILGCIMNKAPGGRRGYGGYYGGKYGYGYRRYSSSDADGKKGRRLRARKSREKA